MVVDTTQTRTITLRQVVDTDRVVLGRIELDGMLWGEVFGLFSVFGHDVVVVVVVVTGIGWLVMVMVIMASEVLTFSSLNRLDRM